jgi:hypothetical protein
MRYNSVPANTLFAKVSVKQHPYSQQPISILVTAAMHPNFTVSQALYFTELDLQTTTLDSVQAAVDRFQIQANAASSVIVKISPKVFKLVQSDVV